MKNTVRHIGALIGAIAALVASPSIAQPASLPDATLERLRLSPGAEGSLVFSGGRLLRLGSFRLAGYVHYENGAYVLRPSGGGGEARLEHRASGVVSAAWAPLAWLQLNAELPIVGFQQEQGFPSGVAALDTAGLAAPTLGVRFALLTEAEKASTDLSLGLDAILPFGTKNILGFDSRGPVLLPRISVGKSVDKVRFGADLSATVRRGIVVRSDTESSIVGREVGIGAFVSYAATDAFRAELNAFGAIPVQTTGFSAEVLAGARYQPPKRGFELFAVAGPGFGNVVGTPQFRVLAGMAIKPGAPAAVVAPIAAVPVAATVGPAAKNPQCVAGAPHNPMDCPELDKDEDGIPNRGDNCPAAPEDRDRFMDQDGCPDVDNDNDGLVDGKDACPNVAGTPARNGCAVADKDNDGLADEQDRCPNESGIAALAGCPDTDADGVANPDDKCPGAKGTSATGGCPDADGDGVADAQDKCPQQAAPGTADGCVPAKPLNPRGDEDRDGVRNAVDQCPTEKGTRRNRGCPNLPRITPPNPNIGQPPTGARPGGVIAPPPTRPTRSLLKITRDRIVPAQKIRFAGKTANIDRRSNRILDQVATAVANPAMTKLTIEAHTDDVGGPAANKKLSQQRADALKAYLVKKGAPAAKIDAKGFGADRPIESNTTAKGRAANDRVELRIVTSGPLEEDDTLTPLK